MEVHCSPSMAKSDISNTTKQFREEVKEACLENSKSLLLHAREQLLKGSYGLSTFLAITAYEESLKYGLLQAYESKLLTSDEYNNFSSFHLNKLLSQYSFIEISVQNNKLHQKYTLPGSSIYRTMVSNIIDRREKSLYVDFQNGKLSNPKDASIAFATEEINRAYKSIASVTLFEQLKRDTAAMQEIDDQIIVIPKPLTKEISSPDNSTLCKP